MAEEVEAQQKTIVFSTDEAEFLLSVLEEWADDKWDVLAEEPELQQLVNQLTNKL